MKIAIVTPSAAGKRSGNQHTAQRWASFLRKLGHDVSSGAQWNGRAADLLIALHARKSAPSIGKFHAGHPRAPLVVVLTGTDLYRDIKTSSEARQAMEIASRLVVLQPQGRLELKEANRRKTRVIYQSAQVDLRHAPPARRFRVAVVGHLREEKDPFRTAIALSRLPQYGELEVVQVGAALSREMEHQARLWTARDPRYRWIGSKPHHQALRWMAGSHLLVVSSAMEGGANVICEAARIGVPVLASNVSGNVGMLGRNYPGYFRVFEEKELAWLIERAAHDAGFYRKLKRATQARAALFAPAAEKNALRKLVREIKLLKIQSRGATPRSWRRRQSSKPAWR